MLDQTKRVAMEEERLNLQSQQLADPEDTDIASSGVFVEKSSSGGMKVTLRSSRCVLATRDRYQMSCDGRRSLGPGELPANETEGGEVGSSILNPICTSEHSWRARCQELQVLALV